jgi:hypothetical protein
MPMRHLLIAAAALMAGPAMAVDYAKCEAINKAYGRVLAQQKQALDEDYTVKLKAKEIAQCGERDPSVNQFNGYIQCTNRVFLDSTTADRDIREAPIKAFYAKKLVAIQKDNAKEGCP